MAVFIKRRGGNSSGRVPSAQSVRGSGYSSPRSGVNSVHDFDALHDAYSDLASIVPPSLTFNPFVRDSNGVSTYDLVKGVISGKSVISANSAKNTGGLFDKFLKTLSSFDSPRRPRSGSGSGSFSSGSSQIPSSPPDYLNADLARHYGMDAATAYSEALANTAHQREVKDLQAAGLNPVLSTRYGGASGVSGASVYAPAVESVSSSSGAVNAKEASVLANLASGVVGLITGSSAKSNAAKDIINSLGDIVSSVSTPRE